MYLAVINTWTIIVLRSSAMQSEISGYRWCTLILAGVTDRLWPLQDHRIIFIRDRNGVWWWGRGGGGVVGGEATLTTIARNMKKSNFIFYFCQLRTQDTKISLLAVLDIISHLQIKSRCNNNFKVVNHYINNNKLQ